MGTIINQNNDINIYDYLLDIGIDKGIINNQYVKNFIESQLRKNSHNEVRCETHFDDGSFILCFYKDIDNNISDENYFYFGYEDVNTENIHIIINKIQKRSLDDIIYNPYENHNYDIVGKPLYISIPKENIKK